VDGGTWPPRARCMARTALYQGGQRLALPHSRPIPQGRSRWRPRFCAWGRRAPIPKFSRLEDLADFDDTKSVVSDTCIGGLSRRVHGSGQSKRWCPGASAGSLSAYAGASFAAGGCAPVCRPRHVRRAVRDSGYTIGGAVPEVGRPAAHISESVVWPPGLALPFGGLLWAARSAVACPGCP
jgi:hypothetical protein